MSGTKPQNAYQSKGTKSERQFGSSKSSTINPLQTNLNGINQAAVNDIMKGANKLSSMIEKLSSNNIDQNGPKNTRYRPNNSFVNNSNSWSPQNFSSSSAGQPWPIHPNIRQNAQSQQPPKNSDVHNNGTAQSQQNSLSSVNLFDYSEQGQYPYQPNTSYYSKAHFDHGNNIYQDNTQSHQAVDSDFSSIHSESGSFPPIFIDEPIEKMEEDKIRTIFDGGIESCNLNDIIYVLLVHRPFKRPGSLELKDHLANSIVKALNGKTKSPNSDRCFYFQIKEFIENEHWFEEIALLFMYAAARNGDPIVQQLVFSEMYNFFLLRTNFIHRIVMSRNLDLLKPLQTFLSSIIGNESCITLDIVDTVRMMRGQDIYDFFHLIFPKDIQKKHPEFMFMLSKIKDLHNDSYKELIDFSDAKEPSTDKTLQCYRQSAFNKK